MYNIKDDIEYLEDWKILGYGAYSKVYKIRLKSDNKVYALKEINLSELNQKDKINLQNEIQLHRQINHPNVVQFKDFF